MGRTQFENLRVYHLAERLADENVANLRPILEELAPKINAYLKSIGRAGNETVQDEGPSK